LLGIELMLVTTVTELRRLPEYVKGLTSGPNSEFIVRAEIEVDL